MCATKCANAGRVVSLQFLFPRIVLVPGRMAPWSAGYPYWGAGVYFVDAVRPFLSLYGVLIVPLAGLTPGRCGPLPRRRRGGGRR